MWLSEGEAGRKRHPLCDGKKAISPCKQHRRTGGMRFLKVSPFLGISLKMNIFYEISAVLKAIYLSLAQYTTLRSALVFEGRCFEQLSDHH